MVGLTLGTGVGGVLAIDGRVHQGHDGTGGELGHQTIDPDGPWCGCGNRGCVEAYARADQIAAACGTATAEEAVRAAQAGDERAREGLAAVGRHLGIGISNAVVVVNPDRVVIGGGVAAAGDLLFDPDPRRDRQAGDDHRDRQRRRRGCRAGDAGRGDRGCRPQRGAGGGDRSQPGADRRRVEPGAGRRGRGGTDETARSVRAVIPDSYVPRYREIEQALRERIADLKPGDPLPSDAALCREFGVSRMTARNAVGRLAEEGLITREPGRGSFVAVPQSHRWANCLMSFSDEMRRQGRAPRSRLLRRELRPARPDEIRDLRLGEGEPVVALVRIRLADDVPIAVEAVALHGRCAAIVMRGRPRDRLAPRGAPRRRLRARPGAGDPRRGASRRRKTPTSSASRRERRSSSSAG